MVSKLIAKTPIKIEQELKQKNENEQKQEVASGAALLRWCRAGSSKRSGALTNSADANRYRTGGEHGRADDQRCGSLGW